MNAKIVLGLSLMGLLAFSFVPYEARANDNGTVLKTKSEDRCAKGKTPSPRRMAVTIGKFENKTNMPDKIFMGIRTRIQQCIAGTMKFEVQDREHLKEILREEEYILVPEGRLMRRVAQIGGGKVFGSEAFVVATAFALGDLFQSRHVSTRAVDELGYATHGWKLAKECAA